MGLGELNISMKDLMSFHSRTPETPFLRAVPRFPIGARAKKKKTLLLPGQHPAFIPPHFPSFPEGFVHNYPVFHDLQMVYLDQTFYNTGPAVYELVDDKVMQKIHEGLLEGTKMNMGSDDDGKKANASTQPNLQPTTRRTNF
eukprot:TRINITY_DN5120_c0_g2_i3.p1 TRINITY_DN5120_c0_g2~~TRINITY_DN5120_c0_g2_i3.p1  ORF type:complete len:142 (-),score=35.83 TRINITY_DN5120_c0_g2_i3:551-976(-)